MKVRAARAVSLFSYLSLIAWVMLWIILLGEVERQHKSILLLLLVTPLLIPLRGVLAGRDKALVWGTLVSLLYAVHGGMVALSPDPDWPLGLVEAGLSLLFLFSASLFIRWRAQAAEAARAE